MLRALVLPVFALCFAATAAHAQAIPNTPTIRVGGNINFVATGGSLRTQPDTGDPCAVTPTSSQSLSGIPAGATIKAAYLYWGGSGTTIDSSVTLNGSAVNASRTFTSSYNNGGTLLSFFGGFADVTSLISGNGTLTFGALSVNAGGSYCTSSAVLAGWSVIAIYERKASEPYRVINIFDGLQSFRGSALTLIPTGFRIPTGTIDGKMTVVTWEGDPGNSTPLNGFSESLTFNGTLLDDGIVPAGSDPTVQQYDGTINTLGISNSYGVDVDTYNVTGLLSAGQTFATTNYSAGGDLVLLTAQIVSVTSQPLIDLQITKTHTGNFTVGTNASYTLHVQNGTGVETVDYPITVTDVLPTGLTFVSATGTGWTCGASSQTVTCTTPGPLAAGTSLPNITLNVAVGNAAYPSVANTASVSAPSTVDINTANDTATDTATVLGSNLSTSTKAVVDLNGGDADPGDTLRYTITLKETANIAATAVSVVDDVPGNVSGFTVVSTPIGSTNSSTSTGTGANNTGYLNITNITVPANGTVTIVFDVQVAAGTSPGATIDNTATIANPGGVDAAPSASQVVVSQSKIPGAGTKQLYLWSNPGQTLSRIRPTGTHNAVTIAGNNDAEAWTLTPALQKAVTLQPGNFLVPLLLARTGATNTSRTLTVTLSNSSTGTVATTTQTFSTMSTTTTLLTFTLNTTGITAPVGSTFTLTIRNNSNNTSTRSISVTPYSGATYSRVELNSATIINVDSMATYTAAYPATTTATSFVRGATAYIRAIVSDPFGSFDIASTTLTLLDPNNVTQLNAQAMTQVNDSGAATKTYQYAYAIPNNAAPGTWTIRVTANEGVEGVTDLGVGTFTVNVPLPTLQVAKISEVLSDPTNGTTNPKRVPDAVVRYTITVANSGPGTVDASTLVILDPLPTATALYVSTASGNPVEFIDGPAASGLTYNYAANVSYSNQPGGAAPFTYTPTPDANGFDAQVTGIRIAPTGVMAAASGATQPSFSIRFRVRIK